MSWKEEEETRRNKKEQEGIGNGMYEFTVVLHGQELTFQTEKELFSPRKLDPGTSAMLAAVDFQEGDKVCDLGCGYGVVGILASRFVGPDRVVMLDNDELAIRLSRDNAARNQAEGIQIVQSDGFDGTRETDFSLILCHPPYHADFSVAKRFIEKGFNRLLTGGRMVLVTKRKEWYKNKLIAVFGGVRIIETDGYFVFLSVKQSANYASVRPNKKRQDLGNSQ